jgi:hypothetical protein
MKKSLLLLILIISSQVYAQDYKPLLDNYNEWNLKYCFTGCSTDVYYTNGDTIVDGMNFKILDGYHYISRGFLLREDVTEKKVFLKIYFPSGDIGDYLLYDFSLAVGDSIDMKNPITPFIENAGYYRVDSIIPRPLVDGNEYRHFYLSPGLSNTIAENNAIWVEGGGSLSIITAPGGDPDIFGVGQVSCIFKNGSPFYTDFHLVDECEASIILDTSEFENSNTNAQIIGKPTRNEFEIINIDSFTRIDIFSLSGVKLDSYPTNNRNAITLDVSRYSAAMYLLVLKSKNSQSQSLKLIVE